MEGAGGLKKGREGGVWVGGGYVRVVMEVRYWVEGLG